MRIGAVRVEVIRSPRGVVRAIAAFLGLGLATTLAICAGAVVWNARSTAVDNEKVASHGWNEVLAVPADSPLYAKSAYELRYRGLAVFMPSDAFDAAAQELKRGEFGPIRSAVYSAQPLLYSNVLSRPRQTAMVGWCGGCDSFPVGTDPARTRFDWRWFGAGWPFVALQCDAGQIETYGLASSRVFSQWFGVSGGCDISKLLPRRSKTYAGAMTQTVMPLTPVWAGLGANSLAFAGIWFAAASAARAIRNWWKPRAGCCAGCGYEMTGLRGTVCPECGTAACSMLTSNRVRR